MVNFFNHKKTPSRDTALEGVDIFKNNFYLLFNLKLNGTLTQHFTV